ncbi:type IV secretion system protein [Paracraurococcus lichenis]|uniref:Type IV secretion system protein n=1 Tax=Paracraurococcus lichenis TaxID=3064888 RepID=A0ABT9E6L2_9PROT|nr:type IV secretion system protein [Paracraurococcus sp. LOR1-02]MDO9711781.1 type IV secretion system protein [Paracraurococcus sp. LOR1-02]
MNCLILAGAVGAALGLLPHGQARAQIAVSCVTCPTEVQEALRFGKQLAEYANQLRELQAIYYQANATYQAFTNIRDLGSAVGALQTVGISNPLPVNPYALQALMGGYGGAQGMIGQIGNLFATNSQNLSVYQCNNGSWLCGAMERFRNGAAGTQAAAMQLYTSAADRAPQIMALQVQIAAARTPAEREALTAQLTAANAQSNNQLVQAIAVQTFGQQQLAMREQQGTERLQQSIDEELQRLRARGYLQ